jgi:uncharacterized protein (DUF305 family)
LKLFRSLFSINCFAIFMSKKLLEKNNNISLFLENIIKTQENEITILKQ